MLLQKTDHQWMQQAIYLAQKADDNGEVPVGAIVVHQGVLIGQGYNQSITTNDPTAHAEIIALRHAGSVLNNYRLLQTTVYVTLEPCMMCVGALIHSRIARLVYGTADTKTGAVNSTLQLLDHPQNNHRIQVCAGVLHTDCSMQLKYFFRRLRQQKKKVI